MRIYDRGCWLIFFGTLVWLAWGDWRTRKISNRGLLFLFLIRTYVLIWSGERGDFGEAFWGFWIGGGVFFVVYWVTKEIGRAHV